MQKYTLNNKSILFKPISNIFDSNSSYLLVGHTCSCKTTTCIDIIYHYSSIFDKIYYAHYDKYKVLKVLNVVSLNISFKEIYDTWNEIKLKNINKTNSKSEGPMGCLHPKRNLFIIDDLSPEIIEMKKSREKVIFENESMPIYKAMQMLLNDIFINASLYNTTVVITSIGWNSLGIDLKNVENVIITDLRPIENIKMLKKFKTLETKKLRGGADLGSSNLITDIGEEIFINHKYPYHMIVINDNNIFVSKTENHTEIIEYQWPESVDKISISNLAELIK